MAAIYVLAMLIILASNWFYSQHNIRNMKCYLLINIIFKISLKYMNNTMQQNATKF